ncbi:transporter substrate-binding domain-containing protein [Reinekea thalattae]|uniref:Transporter substrate-binding domain-containing protein n=1 Tax=Reinekea thalattae TaxID=2593301 RepID=A0A5C8Z949_9GAMM|nr:transporter substrate-binding domain-containing protein [Reinekea thalattae]TXR53376.1 transporter substrate-binding domain-containing protein [Reinekea thalattae]
MKKTLRTIALSALACAAISATAAEVVKVGIAAEPYPPMSTLKPDGTWEGFEVELLDMICEEAGVECEITAVAWDGIIPSLVSKKIDMIFTSMSATEERAKRVLFSAPYYNTPVTVIGLPGQTWEISKDNLKRKIIGVQSSTVAGDYIKDKAEKLTKIREYNTQDEVNSDLLAGRIDFMLADGIVAMELYNANQDSLEVYGNVAWDPMLGTGASAAFRHEDTALEAKITAAIKKLTVSDEYEALSVKYLGTNVAP